MTSLQNTKKNSEFVWASAFVSYINKQYKTNYRIVPELSENSPIDMHLLCDNCSNSHLDLQLTHAVEVPFIALEEHMNIDYSKNPTLQAIDRKTQKLTQQRADLSKIILIIQGYMNSGLAEKVFDHQVVQKYQDSPFAGIYYVVPPMISGETNEFLQNGLVVPIKDFFKSKTKKVIF